MLPGLYQLWQVIIGHFSDRLTYGKNLITEIQTIRVYLFCKYSIILKHCLIKIVDLWYCLIFFHTVLLIKPSHLSFSWFSSSLPFRIFASAKPCILPSFSPWSISLQKKQTVQLKANELIKAPQIVNNTDIIYFIITLT